jgi:DNA-binding beta-propeller fold protein YncE
MKIKQLLIVLITHVLLFLTVASFAESPKSIAYIAGYDKSKKHFIAIVDTITHHRIGNVNCDLGDDVGDIFLATSPDKSKLYILEGGAFHGAHLLIVDATTNKQIGNTLEVPRYANYANSFKISPDGKKGYITLWTSREDLDNQVVVFDTTTNTFSGLIKGFNRSLIPCGVMFSSDSTKGFIYSDGPYQYHDGEISVVDTATDSIIDRIPMNLDPPIYLPERVLLGPDNKKIYFGYDNMLGSLYVDISSKAKHYLGLPGSKCISRSPDNKKIYFLGHIGFDSYLNALDPITDKVTGTVQVPANSYLTGILPDSKIAYVAAFSPCAVYVYDLTTLTQIGTIENLDLNVSSMVFL